MIIQEIQFTKSLTDVSHEQSTDELKGALIVSYEAAIERGIPPHEAIAAVLVWAAEECARLRDKETLS
jgi:hypothetical protein